MRHTTLTRSSKFASQTLSLLLLHRTQSFSGQTASLGGVYNVQVVYLTWFEHPKPPLYGYLMSYSLYTSCAEVLSLSQSRKDDISFLLDPEAGFAPKLRQLCHDTLADVEANGTPLAPEEVNALRLESDTWGLLQAIMP